MQVKLYHELNQNKKYLIRVKSEGQDDRCYENVKYVHVSSLLAQIISMLKDGISNEIDVFYHDTDATMEHAKELGVALVLVDVGTEFSKSVNGFSSLFNDLTTLLYVPDSDSRNPEI